MTVVKGPVIIKRGEPVPDKILDAVGGIKLPFKADGWKSTKMPTGVKVEPAGLVETKKETKEKKSDTKEKKSKSKKKSRKK